VVGGSGWVPVGGRRRSPRLDEATATSQGLSGRREPTCRPGRRR
jgi:hypothetical protein